MIQLTSPIYDVAEATCLGGILHVLAAGSVCGKQAAVRNAEKGDRNGQYIKIYRVSIT